MANKTRYINLDKQVESPGKFRRYIAIGATIAAITAVSFVGYEYKRNTDYWKPRVHSVLGIDSKQNLEYRIDRIEESLKTHPEIAGRIADRLVISGIRIKKENSSEFSPESYYEMFGVIKDKFEQKPELMDYLGPKAAKYQESKLIRRYRKNLGDIYENMKKKAVETKDKIMEKFSD